MALSRRSLLAGAAPALMAAPLRLPQKVRVALIGRDGHTGEVTKPLPQLPDVELIKREYPHWREMLDKEKPDVVGVCNENSNHASVILDCLGRGIHVISEKPIATEMEDLAKVRKAVEGGKSKFTAMLPMRFTPPYLALKQIVDSGELGEVIQIDGQKSYKSAPRPAWFFKRSTYGGTMPWIGIHMIDLMLFTTGRDFKEAFGFQNHIGFPETGDTENVTGTVFRLDNGGVALLRMDYLRPQTASTHGDDRLRIAGTKGVAEYMEATGVTVVSEKRKREVLKDLPAERSLFTAFLDHIYNQKPAPIPWAQILRGHEIVLGARNAMESGKVLAL